MFVTIIFMQKGNIVQTSNKSSTNIKDYTLFDVGIKGILIDLIRTEFTSLKYLI